MEHSVYLISCLFIELNSQLLQQLTGFLCLKFYSEMHILM